MGKDETGEFRASSLGGRTGLFSLNCGHFNLTLVLCVPTGFLFFLFSEKFPTVIDKMNWVRQVKVHPNVAKHIRPSNTYQTAALHP